MTQFQEMPGLSSAEREALKTDIEANGVRIPIEVCAETGEVLDGHHRAEYADACGRGCPIKKIEGLKTDAERRAHALCANDNRRHMSPEQRGVVKVLYREIARALRVEGKTQEEVARRLNVTRQAIAQWENDISNASACNANIDRNQKLTKANEIEIYERTEAGDRQVDIANDFKISQGRVSQVASKIRARKAREGTPADLDAELTGDETIGDARILHGDFRDRLSVIPDSSVDLIVTDPPYPKDDLPLYGELAAFGARVLGPRGILFAYAGTIFLPTVLDLMSEHLNYGWTFCLQMTEGARSRIMGRHIIQTWKPIVAFTRGKWPSGEWADDLFISPERVKDQYEWQQNATPIQRLIEQHSAPKALIVDPFLGVGTTGLASVAAGRRFVGAELDAGRYQTSCENLRGQAEGI